MTNRIERILSLGLAVALLSLPAALAQKTPEFSGFLDDYSRLAPDPEEKESRLIYRNPDHRMSDFDALYVEEPVLMIYPADEPIEIDADKAAKMLRLVNQFDDILREKLEERGVTLVDEAGPGVLHCRWAITNLGRSRFRFLPVGRVLTDTVLAQGRGNAAMEGECLDGGSGEIVAQVLKVDRGRRQSGVTTWAGAKSAIRKWARQLADRIVGQQEEAGG